ncbi:hypothetical protein CspeluHIS016_0505380 [Cutaneotrichosporon spelunceum]|uniref:Uncharacterized protein n=1 Tax=Cutaneotrichosporon spelunceum TaxID=1672016 RepID=A0AAD3YCX3_9TREE|nr:hypothetical protein CspeluHIS016_0505380 [Cutaneotrichosporon spelunceum]
MKVASSKLQSLSNKRSRPRWGWSSKPEPTVARRRAAALFDIETTEHTAVVDEASTSTTSSSSPSPSEHINPSGHPHTAPPRTVATLTKEREARSPAPSPATAWGQPPEQPPEPALHTVLPSGSIKRTTTSVITDNEWAALDSERSHDDNMARQLWPEACPPPNVCPDWKATIRRGIIAAAETARTRATRRKAEAQKTEWVRSRASSPAPIEVSSPVCQPPWQPTSPFYQPSSHPASPMDQTASHTTSTMDQPGSHPSATVTKAVTNITIPPRLRSLPCIELPSPVPGITRERPAWTSPGGPLPPFLRADHVPSDFEEHRWNMAYVVHEVAGLEWHEECLCMDCDDTALTHAQHLPKLWPGREVLNPFIVAYFNGE